MLGYLPRLSGIYLHLGVDQPPRDDSHHVVSKVLGDYQERGCWLEFVFHSDSISIIFINIIIANIQYQGIFVSAIGGNTTCEMSHAYHYQLMAVGPG